MEYILYIFSLILMCISLVRSGELTFELPDNERMCFFEEIEKGLECTLEFQVECVNNYSIGSLSVQQLTGRFEQLSCADSEILSEERGSDWFTFLFVCFFSWWGERGRSVWLPQYPQNAIIYIILLYGVILFWNLAINAKNCLKIAPVHLQPRPPPQGRG